MSDKQTESNTDTVESTQKQAKPTGKGSRNKRTEAFRRKKNAETDAAITAGIFARLKIKDPTAVSSIPLAREVHPATVPISFAALPEYVDRVWDTMEAIGTRPFGQLNTPENKAIFKKGMLILSEVKLCYAQRAHVDKPDEDLPSKKLYTTEELNDFNNMASVLPYPLALYLESIGNCVDGKQIVTPLLAEYRLDNLRAVSGALTFAPRQLKALLVLLRQGIPLNAEVHMIALRLEALPNIEWEEFEGQVIPPAPHGPQMVRLTQRSYEFWIDELLVEDVVVETSIRWTDHEYRTFVKIVQSMNSKKGFNISEDLSSGDGSLVQTVNVINWQIDRSVSWFTMTDVPEFDQKLGAAFNLCSSVANIQPSRFRGTYTTAYWRGEITPRRVMNAILAGQE